MSNYIYTTNGKYKKIKKTDVIEIFNDTAISTNGRCGPSNNQKVCPGNQCCSESGWCGGIQGKKSKWCFNKGIGLNMGYYDAGDGPDRCGSRFKNKTCLGNKCCDYFGQCGGTKGIPSVYCSHSGYGVMNGEYDGR